jgi:hypothetical protein
MAIYHDAYLFKTEEFERDISKYLEPLRNLHEGYTLLRSRALEVFKNSSQVRDILAEYGGWDLSELLTFPANSPNTAHDVAFWMMVLLYDSLYRTSKHDLGLGGKHDLLKHILQTLEWNDRDIHLVLKGRSFVEFATEHLQADDEFWRYLQPHSTASWAGWLSHDDVKRLYGMLTPEESRLPSATLVENRDAILGDIFTVYQRAKQMLGSAIEADCDLAIIISG